MKSLVGGSFGKYRINRMLGKGGMGEVYEAYDTDKGRTVALKVLADQYAQDDTFRTRFLRESRAAAVLQEPHVIPIHDWGEIDETLYIDMRLVQGQTLAEMLKVRALEPQRAVDIVRQVAAALDAAHAEGLIHRDVKPQNIIVTADDFAYLVDFGIAEARGDTHLTMTGYHIGSFDYMAPERFREQAATAAVDIYALGCVLYEALTGRKPFPGPSEQVITGHLSMPPPRASAVDARVPASLDDVIARAMAKEPDDRYGSAGALGRAAMRALTEVSTAPRPAPAMPPPVYMPPPTAPPLPNYGFPSGPRPYSRSPATGPDRVATPPVSEEPSSRSVVPIVVAVAAAVVVIVVAATIGVLISRNSGSDNATQPTIGYSTPSSNPYDTGSLSTTSSRTVAPTSQDPTQQLRQIADGDRSFVSAQLADKWVPQLSSKQLGMFAEGRVWDGAAILQEYQQLQQRFPGARLLKSGEWSTFSGPDYWVTVAGIRFDDSAGALAWCRGNGFDRDHCIAKIVSTTHPVAGSTAYNN
ncbi:serine/threonine protein kinase [Mycobacterium sp. 1164966.3]|uniref:serine/threonine-protein kinase n=1 Tax=Mycobacterium sp. 1164966.3 TaxID=1856861 RepID=UPI0008023DF0|nr:serine/threonine-protein kinase [Mycobacterium sp. 1164966.3]OBA78146.1 serine/threonine protein kinase [Mycobacterium sp. 1164966.3]